jgi:pyridoxamine 5'-phosphate oxidase-like protein
MMATQQGSLDLLNDPVAQKMLQSTVPARFAYIWTDGTPRVVPIGFHWTGSEIVLGTPPDAPKVKALEKNTKVALTIDSDTMPFKVLMVRGTCSVTLMDGIVPEYELMCIRTMGQEGANQWLQQMRGLFSKMTRVAIKPEWAGILDFETRFPSAVENAIARASGQD